MQGSFSVYEGKESFKFDQYLQLNLFLQKNKKVVTKSKFWAGSQ